MMTYIALEQAEFFSLFSYNNNLCEEKAKNNIVKK